MSLRTALLLAAVVAAPVGAQWTPAPPMAVYSLGPTEPASEFNDRRHAQDPADSTYRAARTLLNRGEWRRAATLFASIATKYPNSEYRADALYWQAFALYRIGGTTELREALNALDARIANYPGARSQGEAASLAVRISDALVVRGVTSAAAAVSRRSVTGTEPQCDAEELSVRSSALHALQRADPEAANAQLTRVLARRDECSVPLRRTALSMIAARDDAAARTTLVSVATSDPSAEVRSAAVSRLGNLSGDEVVTTLEQIIRGSDTERIRRAAVRALGDREGARAKAAMRALVERRDAPEALRLEAIATMDPGGSSFDYSIACQDGLCATTSLAPLAPMGAARPGTPAPPAPPAAPAAPRPATAPRPAAMPGVPSAHEPLEVFVEGPSPRAYPEGRGARVLSAEDAAWLRGVYPRLETTRLKSRAATVITRATDEASINWLMALVQREEESADVRSAVLARLGRVLPIAQLGRLYDTASDQTVRRQIVSTLGERDEAAATDKLIEIVRAGTDPQLRRSAISALTRKKDPRTTQLLLEMIDK